MELTFNQGKYYISCEYGERQKVKDAGFKWDRDAKRWYTDSFYVAMQISDEEIEELPQELVKLNERYQRSYAKTPIKKTGWDERMMPFQQAGVEEILNRGNVLLADEQGLGKTLQALGYLNFRENIRVVIVTPATIKLGWRKEIYKWADVNNFYLKILDTGMEKIGEQRSLLSGKLPNVICVSYDLLKSKFTLDQLLRFNPDILIGDEGHYLKNAKTARTKNFTKLSKGAYKIIIITGTPILNRPMEVYTLVMILDHSALAPYQEYRRFAYRFCNAYNDRMGRLDTSGNSNMAELGVRLRATIMVRRLKKDVMPQLPKKLVRVLPFRQCAKSKAVVQREEWLFLSDLKKSPARGDMGEQAEIRKELALLRLPQAIQLIKDKLENVDKLIVYAYHHVVLQALKEKLEAFNPVLLTGKLTPANKQKAIQAFRKDPEVKIFIGQIQTMAGIDGLQDVTSTIIFAEGSYVPGIMDQATDRVNRIGTKNCADVSILVTENSNDESMFASMYAKTLVINQILQ